MPLLLPAALVVAGGACSRAPDEPGAAPNTDVGLRVWAEVTPAVASVRDTAAVLTVRVHMWNPSAREIRVRSGGPPYSSFTDPAQGRGMRGSFRIASDASPLNAGPMGDWFCDTVYVFPARRDLYNEGQVRLQRDWRGGKWPLVPGRYRVRSWVNGREGVSAPLVLTP